jgi:hypothetical protein
MLLSIAGSRVVVDTNAVPVPSPRLIDLHQQASGAVRFVPGEKALAYAVHDKDVDNISVQQLDGWAGRQITINSRLHRGFFAEASPG